MQGPALGIEVLHVLRQVPCDASGALVRECSDGTMAGALLVEHGRVCWAISQRYQVRLTDILIAEQSTLSAERLDEVVALCQRERMPLGETLLSRGLVSLPVLHRALLRHTCEALDCLIRDDASPWSWVEHTGYGYHPLLTFSAAEVLAGSARSATHPSPHGRWPGCATWSAATSSGSRSSARPAPSCRWRSSAASAATVDLGAAIMELDGLACASWIEDGVLFVVLCDGELAFNRLLAQVAAMTTRT